MEMKNSLPPMEMKNYFENTHNLRMIARIFASLCRVMLVTLQLRAEDLKSTLV